MVCVIKAMKNLSTILFLLLAWAGLAACSDDDSFTTASTHQLTFSQDTLSLGTVFSTVPSAARSFWVYNRSGDGLRCTSVRLENGGSSGFRVNVDGQYLSAQQGYAVSDVEIRNKDSVRVFVELTSKNNNSIDPQRLTDNLVFTLESGVEQKVNLNAYSWDATILCDLRISHDSTITCSQKPIIIYGGLQVDSAAKLTVEPGVTLYFHGNAGIHVHGTLNCEGTAAKPITFRGDRIDHMFDYLPYDNVPGQWQGVHFYASSYENVLDHVDIHSAFDGVVADSSDVNRLKLTMDGSTVHNCQGWGLWSKSNYIVLSNSLISNTLKDCLHLEGGRAEINGCTLAQFYPFVADRGMAINATADAPMLGLNIINSLITGYADDEMLISPGDSTRTFNYQFDHCIIRTPKITTADSVHFTHVTYEDPKDTVSYGYKHFKLFDTDNLRYDFSLDSVSAAIDKADPATALPVDHNGAQRDGRPDIGAFEFLKKQ